MTLAAGVTKMRKVNIESIFRGDHNMFTDYDTENDFFFRLYFYILCNGSPQKYCAVKERGSEYRHVTLTFCNSSYTLYTSRDGRFAINICQSTLFRDITITNTDYKKLIIVNNYKMYIFKYIYI